MVKQYDVPIVGERLRPFSNPSGTIMSVVGMVVGLTVLLYAYLLARNRGVPLMNQLVSMVPGIGDRLTTQGQGPGVF